MRSKFLKAVLALALLAAVAIPVVLAQGSGIYLVTSQWVNGDLQFTDIAHNPILTLDPSFVNLGNNIQLQLNGTPVTASAAELNQYTLDTYVSDAGTGGGKKAYVVAPTGGKIVGLAAVNYAANATTATNFTAKISGSSVTIPTWQQTATQAAGTATSVVPTAANTVTAGQVVEIDSDGGSSSVMPCEFTVTINRTQ